MNNSNQSKQVLLSVIGVAILVVAVVGVSFAFFSYVNNGTNNTIETGTISLSSVETGSLTVTNAFPVSSEDADDVMTVTVSGQTSYEGGVYYDVRALNVSYPTAVDVNGNQVLPTIETTCSENAVNSNDISCSGATVDLSTKTGSNNVITLATGFIGDTAAGSSAGSQTITIKAYYDADEYWISDNGTLSEVKELNESAGLVAPTTQKIVTTEEWNKLQSNPVSFTIQVRGTEGVNSALNTSLK